MAKVYKKYHVKHYHDVIVVGGSPGGRKWFKEMLQYPYGTYNRTRRNEKLAFLLWATR